MEFFKRTRGRRIEGNRLWRLGVLIAALAQGTTAEYAVSAEVEAEPVLVRLFTKSARSHVGELVKEDAQAITLIDLQTGQEVTVATDDTLRIVKPLSLDEAARAAGLPAIAGWKISQMASQEKPLGKVAQVTPQVVYVTLGSDRGATLGQKLIVFRNKGEIRDPDTGAVLAVERPRVAELEVVEVNAAFSKARIKGDLEVTLEVGDEVEPDKHGLRVAVCPLLNEDGTLTNVGSSLAEDMVTTLVQRNVTVVERSVMDMVLGELLVQNTVLFEQRSAQKLGRLTGANVVLTGKIVPDKNVGRAYVRLIDVQTGEIQFAASSSINLVGARAMSRIAAPGGVGVDSGEAVGVATRQSLTGGRKSGRLGKPRTLPGFLTTNARYQRTQDGGIRLQGAESASTRDRNAVRTRDTTYLTKDFTYEVLLTFAPGDRIALIGLGAGTPDRSHNSHTDSVYIRFHAPTLGDGMVDVSGFKKGYDGMGKVTHIGTHLVRIIKEGDAVTFQVDPDNDGPSDDDLELTIPNIREYAPFFNSKNMPLFFGGSGTFLEVSIQD